MLAGRGAWIGLLGLLSCAVFAVPRVVSALSASYGRVRDAFECARESEEEALVRFRSPEYVEALARVKAVIPRDAAYYIVPADGEEQNLVFIRFDLAPRRTEKFGPGASPEGAKWVVLSRIEPPGPEVVETAEYLRSEAAGSEAGR